MAELAGIALLTGFCALVGYLLRGDRKRQKYNDEINGRKQD